HTKPPRRPTTASHTKPPKSPHEAPTRGPHEVPARSAPAKSPGDLPRRGVRRALSRAHSVRSTPSPRPGAERFVGRDFIHWDWKHSSTSRHTPLRHDVGRM